MVLTYVPLPVSLGEAPTNEDLASSSVKLNSLSKRYLRWLIFGSSTYCVYASSPWFYLSSGIYVMHVLMRY